jgi:hypothetical protein
VNNTYNYTSLVSITGIGTEVDIAGMLMANNTCLESGS